MKTFNLNPAAQTNFQCINQLIHQIIQMVSINNNKLKEKTNNSYEIFSVQNTMLDNKII